MLILVMSNNIIYFFLNQDENSLTESENSFSD